jgi:hypothetical protein
MDENIPHWAPCLALMLLEMVPFNQPDIPIMDEPRSTLPHLVTLLGRSGTPYLWTFRGCPSCLSPFMLAAPPRRLCMRYHP